MRHMLQHVSACWSTGCVKLGCIARIELTDLHLALQTVTEWTVDPSAAFPLRPAKEISAASMRGRVHFARAGPDMGPEVESLLKAASKHYKYQRKRSFQLPEHDVRPHEFLALSSRLTSVQNSVEHHTKFRLTLILSSS